MAGQPEAATTRIGAEPVVADGLDLLRADHRRLQELLAELGSDSGSSSANVYGRRRAADALVAELRAHLAAEDRCLHPLLGELGSDGRASLERETAGREQAADFMDTLLGADPMENAFAPAAAHLLGHVERHIARQEETLFPLLFQSAGPDELAALGEQLRQAKAGTTPELDGDTRGRSRM
jgi:hemerythrin-like domain-containing protein